MQATPNEEFNPLRFLELAKDLAKSNDESNLRTAVGRAYYAIFLTIRKKLGVDNEYEVHAAVFNRLVRLRKTMINTQLSEMKRLRVTADYEITPVNEDHEDWRKNWERQDLLANTLLSHVKSL